MASTSRNESIAVIDVGSNTVLLTCGFLDARGKLQVLRECHEVARLGEGLQDGGTLQPKAKQRVLETLTHFLAQIADLNPRYCLAAGTAAFRRATDGQVFAQEITQNLNLPVKILTGEEEAHYSFLSATQDFGHLGALGMIDIGGGSTEFVFGGTAHSFSLPIGTVRLQESFSVQHPVPDSTWDALGATVREKLDALKDQALPPLASWVGVAATPATLASVMLGLPCFDAEKIQGFTISLPSLEDWVEKLRNLSIPERQKLPGMEPKRAELLPLGGKILLESMRRLGIPSMLTSHRGLRYGLLWELLQRQVPA